MRLTTLSSSARNMFFSYEPGKRIQTYLFAFIGATLGLVTGVVFAVLSSFSHVNAATQPLAPNVIAAQSGNHAVATPILPEKSDFRSTSIAKKVKTAVRHSAPSWRLVTAALPVSTHRTVFCAHKARVAVKTAVVRDVAATVNPAPMQASRELAGFSIEGDETVVAFDENAGVLTTMGENFRLPKESSEAGGFSELPANVHYHCVYSPNAGADCTISHGGEVLRHARIQS